MTLLVSRKQASAVTAMGTDVDHQRQELYLVFGHGNRITGPIMLDYSRLKELEDHLRKMRMMFDHANAIAKERQQRYVDPNSMAIVD